MSVFRVGLSRPLCRLKELADLKFSLKTLILTTSVVAVLSWIFYLINRPFYRVARIDCGNSQYVDILKPNKFCDVGGTVHYSFNSRTSESPPSFSMWSCGSNTELIPKIAVEHDLIALVGADNPREIHIIINRRTGWSWPATWNCKLNKDVRRELAAFQESHPQCWLNQTYDGSLTLPMDQH